MKSALKQLTINNNQMIAAYFQSNTHTHTPNNER